MSSETASSSLLLDEYLDAGDVRAVDELLKSRAQKRLAGYATRLLGDHRPFAREVLFRYVDDGCDRPGHRVFVKTLFKTAEKNGDVELLGRMAVVFDRLVRRRLVQRSRWDWSARRAVNERAWLPPVGLIERLPRWTGDRRTYVNPVTGVSTRVYRPHVPLRRPPSRWERSRLTGKWGRVSEGAVTEAGDPLRFSVSTRRYLQRRTWRFFRQLAKKSESTYRTRVLDVVWRFEDQHLASVEALLDSWFLVHVLYGRSEIIHRHPLGARVAAGKSMADLAFAPFAPEAWRDCSEELFVLLARAKSRPVRRFAIWALETAHADLLKGLPVQRLVTLLKSPHEEVQTFGGRCLAAATGMESLPISDWLSLLAVPSTEVLLAVCAEVKKHVAPTRLSLEQCVQLACAKAAPVAELGLEWTKARPPRMQSELETILKLRHAECQSVRVAAAEWVSQQLLLRDDARPRFVRDLLDARFVEVRAAAISLMGKDQRFGDSVELWMAMSETPWSDVRDHFLQHVEAREKLFPPETLQRVWATTLLSPHRGNRARRHAARQVASRLIAKKEERQELIRLLGFTLRSVRATERTAALAQLVRAATADAELQALLAKELPELQFVGDGVSE